MSTQTGLLTADELAALSTEGLRLELVRGELRARPPAQGNHGKSAMRVGSLVGHYILTHDLGEVYAAETGFLIERNPDTVRAPDFAFIEKTRVTPEAAAASWVPISPDLVVEVVSSGDRQMEIAEKIAMWLAVGVRLPWVVYPERREVVVHQPGQAPRVLSLADTLSGEEVVPGFSCPVAQVFGA